jgi:hypothetical protein
MENKEERKIKITGQANRYQIKKLTTTTNPDERSQRVIIQKLKIEDSFFAVDKQKELLLKIHNKAENNLEVTFSGKEEERIYNIMIKQLEAKISSYKQQDKLKEIDPDETTAISVSSLVKHILQCDVKCFYCHVRMMILYKQSRDPTQWTIDRIDNNLGHTVDNYVVACLGCNLKRRRQDLDKFNYTKNLTVLKCVSLNI